MVTKIIIVSTLILSISFTSKAQSGASTPNELFTKIADAWLKEDYESLGKLFIVLNGDSKKETEAFLNIIMLYPHIMDFKQQGLKKFGNDFKHEVINNSLFDYGVNWKFDFDAAKNTKYEIQNMFGDKIATSTTNVAWENFGKPLDNPVTAIEVNGRWYIKIANNRVDLYTALSIYLVQAQKLLHESNTAAEFADKLKVHDVVFDDFFKN